MAADYWFQHVSRHPFFDGEKEHLVVLLLNTKLRCFAWNMVSIGSLNEALFHPREVFRPAIVGAAFGLLVMHNHPSADTTPSDADRRVTVRLKETADLLQIRCTDHVIVGRTRADFPFSFRAAGTL